MKKLLLGLSALSFAAIAAVAVVNVEDRGWQLIRGTANVGTPHTTEALCTAAGSTDAQTRKASANYRCVLTKAFRVNWSADPVVPQPPVVEPPVTEPPVTDPHQGGHHSGNMPHYNPATIPPAAVGSSTLDIRFTGERPYASADSSGNFRTVCTPSHFNRDDSLVYPGQPGAAHLHMYFGNTLSNANSTPESIRNSGNSTCRGGIANRSTYWVPAVIDTSDGSIVKMDHADVYYKSGWSGVQPADVKPIPEGLRMIVGDMRKTTITQWGPFTFQCNGGAKQFAMVSNCTSGTMVIELTFPQCWDGQRLYAADQSHMKKGNGGCPASHPVALPEISYIMHFPIPAGRNTSNWRLSSDNYVGGPGGYSMHGDWINGWLKGLPEVWTKEVINPRLSGGSHILGDGRVMY